MKRLEKQVKKKKCAEFLESIFQYVRDNFVEESILALANISSLLDLARNAIYHVDPQEVGALATPGGVDVTTYFADNPQTRAFVEQDSNNVYWRADVLRSSLSLTLLHEAFHIFYWDEGLQTLLGIGLDDGDLAIAAGVYRDEHSASWDFNAALEKHCK